MSAAPEDLQFVRDLVAREAAIVLEERQAYLIEARLRPLAREMGCQDVGDLVRKLRRASLGALRTKVIDAMTTNETSFFRNGHPFEALEKHVLPDLMRARQHQRRLRIWCGAAASGQEPYSVAMVCRRVVPLHWRLDMVATDLSAEMIRRCKEGTYTQFEVNRGLPSSERARWFTQVGPRWRVRDELRKSVRFGVMNLARPWPRTMGQFDIIFLRNVLIYFDDATRTKVLERVQQHLTPDGTLFLGTAESPSRHGVDLARKRVGPSICFVRQAYSEVG